MPAICFTAELPYRNGPAVTTFETELGAKTAARLTGGRYLGPMSVEVEPVQLEFKGNPFWRRHYERGHAA